MHPDRIMEGLKQGNSIELELVEKLREGLGLIADGMRTECLNRSDALRELREELETERIEPERAAALQEQIQLTRLVQVNIREYQDTIVSCKEQYQQEVAAIRLDFEIMTQYHGRLRENAAKQQRILNNFVLTMKSRGQVEGIHELREMMRFWQTSSMFLDNEYNRLQERRVGRSNEAWSRYQRETRTLHDQIRVLERIAESAGLDVEED
ncbi:hypothetical protein P153DRAFT_392984 [Dothidotthia symphoricarpi CBS 119687]|uniref:Uncharacterized protein n=1 Tax=Dothidotthia symphoricarpi CBS 119687 TaxID=1392245 RepID=A0A6A6AMH4_9PLEO|nr:uncharacterized protein P153DRAFT_392984 [Dothidotthia symphoricarpi CBS 119687]KAF2133129.1 hypothetical protein P153DRAFT_392984 [Dothidotthia symphoricarpi CBS 119687]